MDASTSSSPSVRISLKRKAATAATSKLEHVTDDEDGEADEPSSMDESEDGHARDDAARPTDEATQNDDDKTDTALVKAGPAKKAKKELKPKVAVWADLQGWKEGDDPLGRFPVEVLDLIINIDADLDLRDHLALAATCRYFRTCYRDVVFQVLYQSHHPRPHLPAERIIVRDDGLPEDNSFNKNSMAAYYGTEHAAPVPFGPHTRSYNEARWIFSSSKLPRDGWGLPTTEWDGSDAKEDGEEQMRALGAILDSDREQRRPDFEKQVREEDEKAQTKWKKEVEVFKEGEKARNLADRDAGRMLVYDMWSVSRAPIQPSAQGHVGVRKLMDALLTVHVGVYGEGVRPKASYAPSLPKWQRKHATVSQYSTVRDPWASPYRQLVSDIVNKPRISKTMAKSTYKVSDRELLTLKKVFQSHWKHKGTPKYFYKSAVEALSLRSHGGANGHNAYLEKLEVRKDKAHATMVKNGTLKVAKPRYRKNFYGFWGDEYDGYDSDDY